MYNIKNQHYYYDYIFNIPICQLIKYDNPIPIQQITKYIGIISDKRLTWLELTNHDI